jgi:hypothetical protein
VVAARIRPLEIHDTHPVHNTPPDTLSDELVRQGHEVYEALAISEVMASRRTAHNGSIIITPDVDPVGSRTAPYPF